MPDLSINVWPSIASVLNPTQAWTVAPERCSTKTYAGRGADALTQVLDGDAVAADGEPPHAVIAPMIARASVALVHVGCFRTSFPPGGLPFPKRAAER